MTTQERALFQLPSLLLETPLSLYGRIPNESEEWPLHDVSNDIDC
jgi:hypothetical protein